MVNLIKKLETVDDSTTTSSSTTLECPPKQSNDHKKAAEETIITVEHKDIDDTKKISRHLAFMKFISEWTAEKKQKSRKKRNVGGSMRVRNNKTTGQHRNIPRRSSVGVLPGSIGIGSGVVVDYPMTSKSSTTMPSTTKHLSSSTYFDNDLKKHANSRTTPFEGLALVHEEPS